MKHTAFVIGDNHQMKVTDSNVWKDFIDSLNNPTKETVDNRKKLFEECDELIITKENDIVHVESTWLNTDEILAALQKK